MKVRVLLLVALSSLSIAAEPAADPAASIVENYWAASRAQLRSPKSASMEVEIAASLPKLKKEGRLHALRRISTLGRVTYELLRFEGDGTVKNQVIARYLTAEAESQKDQAPAMAVTPDNYKFKYKGREELAGRDVYVFQVTPRQKRQGLFRGDVWIDAGTYLRVQESGYLVKNPSIFLKKIAFTRRYEIRDGLSVPLATQSEIQTRLVGKAEISIEYSHFALDNKRTTASDLDNQ
ncbi:MAG TPA: hypothetical protein VGF59_03300 [Bryobacteraceae bacterium]